MRVCFTSDLHGRPTLYDQLTDLVRAECPELLILGGDMHSEASQDDPLGTQAAFARRQLGRLLDLWRTLVPGLEVACILGNHDMACTQAVLEEHQSAGRLVLLDERRAWPKGGLYWLGFWHTPPSPHWVKDYERLDLPGDPIPGVDGVVWDGAMQRVRPVRAEEYFRVQPTLAEELSAIPPVRGPWVFVCHSPPYGTKLDRLPDVPDPIGSRAVRTFIEARQPLLALHGHVHESPHVSHDFVDRVGRTDCVNPGQAHERLHAVLFDTDDLPRSIRHTVFG